MPVGPNGLILNKNFDVTVHQFWVYGLVSVLANSHVFGGTGQLHFVYDFYYLCIKGHVSWLWFISCLTLCEKKNEACKPVISLLLFFKLGVTLLSWSLPHPWVGFSDEKEYQNRFRNTHTVQNKRNESNAVLYRSAWKKPTQKQNLWGSLQLWACSSALWTRLWNQWDAQQQRSIPGGCSCINAGGKQTERSLSDSPLCVTRNPLAACQTPFRKVQFSNEYANYLWQLCHSELRHSELPDLIFLNMFALWIRLNLAVLCGSQWGQIILKNIPYQDNLLHFYHFLFIFTSG